MPVHRPGIEPAQRPSPGRCLADPAEVQRTLQHLGQRRPGQHVGPGFEVGVAQARELPGRRGRCPAGTRRVQGRDHRPERVGDDRIAPVEEADRRRPDEHVPAVQVVVLDRGRDPRAFQLPGRGRDPLPELPQPASPVLGRGPILVRDERPPRVILDEPLECDGQRGRPPIRDADPQQFAGPTLDGALQRRVRPRMPSHAPRSRSPSPSGRVCRSVGPPSSNSSHPRSVSTSSGSRTCRTSHAANATSSRTSWAVPGPAALHHTGPRSVGMRSTVDHGRT